MDRNQDYRYNTRRPYPARPIPRQDNMCNACDSEKKIIKEKHYPIAMAYVPWQTFDKTYPYCEALMKGTIFPELNLPFEKERCNCK